MRKPKHISNHKLRSALWDEYYNLIVDETFLAKDVVSFAQFIVLLSHAEEAQDELDKNGLFYESTDQAGKLLLKSNPAHKVLADTSRMLIAYYQRFGLSDWDRKSNDKRFNIEKADDSGDSFGDLDN